MLMSSRTGNTNTNSEGAAVTGGYFYLSRNCPCLCKGIGRRETGLDHQPGPSQGTRDVREFPQRTALSISVLV